MKGLPVRYIYANVITTLLVIVIIFAIGQDDFTTPWGTPHPAFVIAIIFGTPVAMWLIWNKWWKPDAEQDRAYRLVFHGLISGVFLAFAYRTSLKDSHSDCSHWVRAGSERECVGDWIMVGGPDWFAVFLLLCVAALSFGSALRGEFWDKWE